MAYVISVGAVSLKDMFHMSVPAVADYNVAAEPRPFAQRAAALGGRWTIAGFSCESINASNKAKGQSTCNLECSSGSALHAALCLVDAANASEDGLKHQRCLENVPGLLWGGMHLELANELLEKGWCAAVLVGANSFWRSPRGRWRVYIVCCPVGRARAGGIRSPMQWQEQGDGSSRNRIGAFHNCHWTDSA